MVNKIKSFIWKHRSYAKAILISFLAKRTVYTNEYITERLNNQIPNLYKGGWRHVLDSRYWTVDKTTFEAMVKSGWSWRRSYLAEKFDCDDFAVAFKGRMAELFGINSVGIMIDWSSKHAYNILILDDGSVHAFEPQAGLWARLGSDNYQCKDGVLIL